MAYNIVTMHFISLYFIFQELQISIHMNYTVSFKMYTIFISDNGGLDSTVILMTLIFFSLLIYRLR